MGKNRGHRQVGEWTADSRGALDAKQYSGKDDRGRLMHGGGEGQGQLREAQGWKNLNHTYLVKVKVKVAQSYPTLCIPVDCIVRGILQARTLEWVAFPFSRGSSRPKGANRGLLHCRRILYQLSYEGSR